jgi:hypothetical protein
VDDRGRFGAVPVARNAITELVSTTKRLPVAGIDLLATLFDHAFHFGCFFFAQFPTGLLREI